MLYKDIKLPEMYSEQTNDLYTMLHDANGCPSTTYNGFLSGFSLNNRMFKNVASAGNFRQSANNNSTNPPSAPSIISSSVRKGQGAGSSGFPGGPPNGDDGGDDDPRRPPHGPGGHGGPGFPGGNGPPVPPTGGVHVYNHQPSFPDAKQNIAILDSYNKLPKFKYVDRPDLIFKHIRDFCRHYNLIDISHYRVHFQILVFLKHLRGMHSQS